MGLFRARVRGASLEFGRLPVKTHLAVAIQAIDPAA
jgi:hypothetical protein